MSIIKTGLLYFDQAIRAGSIRRAAESLKIASSAVNRQLLQLEDELGVELFERLPRGIRPTAAGEALLNYVRQWGRDEVQLQQELGRLQGGVRGTIHIAAAESITSEIIPRAMSQLQAQFPLIDFTLISGDNYFIRSTLLAREADIVCAFDIPSGSRTETVASFDAPIGVITPVGHPLSKQETVSLVDCVDYPIIAPSEDWLRHSVLNDLFEGKKLPFRIAARVERIGMLRNLVQADVGIAFLAAIGLEQDVAHKRLAWTPLEPGLIRPTMISLLAPRGRVLPPYLRSFVDIIRQELQPYCDANVQVPKSKRK